MAKVRLPSVARVLRVQGFYPARMPEQYYLDRGHVAHESFELHDKGTLVDESVDERIQPFLDAHKKAKADLNVKPLDPPINETYIEAWQLGFSGRLDTGLWIVGKRYAVDFKTGDGSGDAATVIQIAAYRTLLAYHLKLPIESVHGAALYYRTDGTYTFHPYSVDEISEGWHEFAAALRTYRWRMAQNRLEVA